MNDQQLTEIRFLILAHYTAKIPCSNQFCDNNQMAVGSEVGEKKRWVALQFSPKAFLFFLGIFFFPPHNFPLGTNECRATENTRVSAPLSQGGKRVGRGGLRSERCRWADITLRWAFAEDGLGKRAPQGTLTEVGDQINT